MRLTRGTLAAGIVVVVVVAIGAGFGGYEIGIRSTSSAPLTASRSSASPSVNSTPQLIPSPSPPTPTTSRSAPPAASAIPSGSGSGPAARGNPSWVYDAASGKYLLFGGDTTTGNYNEFPQPLGDCWTWDGSAWSRIASVAPSPRYNAQVVYDDSSKTVLLFGGRTGSNPEADTWAWDGTHWTQLGPSHTPPGIDLLGPGALVTFDSARGVAVLVVYTFGPSVQTWTWSGSDWTQVTTATALPTNGSASALAYDPGRHTDVYFTHDNSGQPQTWTFDGTNWTQMATTSGSTSRTFVMTRDDATSNVVLFGSNGDTWTWDGTRWSPANPVHSPGQRTGMSITYDSRQKVVSLFAGDTGQGAALQHHTDIWAWSGTDWTLVTGS